MSHFFGQLKSPPRKKPAKWDLDPRRVDPKWRRVWRDACLVLPIWRANSGAGEEPAREYVQKAPTTPAGIISQRSWITTEHGVALRYLNSGYDDVPENILLDECVNEPLEACTILYIRQAHVLGAGAISHFGINFNSPVSHLAAHLPWISDVVFWRFGSSGPNSAVWNEYVKTTDLEYWSLTAGPDGSKIYYDGDLKATNVGDAPRTSSSHQFFLNKATQIGDKVNIHLFAMFNTQWPEAQIAEWYQDPYGFLREHYPASKTRDIRTPVLLPVAGTTGLVCSSIGISPSITGTPSIDSSVAAGTLSISPGATGTPTIKDC